jgi:hypothetical protein
VEWEKVDKNRTIIIVKFTNYNFMMLAIKRFNRISERVGSYMRLQPKTYYKIRSERISSKEFRIHDIPDQTEEESIKKSLRSLLKGEPFFIKSVRSAHNDIIVTLQSDKARHLLKNVWSIEIENDLYRFSPGYFQRSHMQARNTNVAKFSGFNNKKHKLSLILDILKSCDARNAYTKQDDADIYVEFPTPQDMTNACLYTYYNYKMKIIGIPRELSWIERPKFLKDHLPMEKSEVNLKPQDLTDGQTGHTVYHYTVNSDKTSDNNKKRRPDNYIKSHGIKEHRQQIPDCAISSNRIPIKNNRMLINKDSDLVDCIVESLETETPSDLC